MRRAGSALAAFAIGSAGLQSIWPMARSGNPGDQRTCLDRRLLLTWSNRASEM
jgi:hypothetical protein